MGSNLLFFKPVRFLKPHRFLLIARHAVPMLREIQHLLETLKPVQGDEMQVVKGGLLMDRKDCSFFFPLMKKETKKSRLTKFSLNFLFVP